jgi:hypothetical protein
MAEYSQLKLVWKHQTPAATWQSQNDIWAAMALQPPSKLFCRA